MSTGRKYVEKMIEGVGSLGLTGDMSLSGSLNVSGSIDLSKGTYLYRNTMLAAAANINIQPSSSGTCVAYLLSGITASLPDGAVSPDGSTGAGQGSGLEFTFISLIEGGDVRITGSNQGGDGQCFVGSIVGSGTGSNITTPVYAAATANQLNGIGVAFGDSITFVSIGDMTALGNAGGSRWVIKHSSVKIADGIYTFAD